jgi:NADH dehydrogenase/NADH:ubiquinone oxidoreductase subunit G
MVCLVKDVASGQMIPSCSTFPREGMEIDTESDEVVQLRKMSLELLLSDHPARCGKCEGKAKCRLRELSMQMKAKWTRFGPLAPDEPNTQIHVNGRLWFEPAKCIRCGLCVYNSDDGFTFYHRGYGMRVIIPDESKSHVGERLADLCPTAALLLK